MKRVPALLLCLALAAMILQPVPSNVNSPFVNIPQLADDPAPPFPPPTPWHTERPLLADDPAPPFPPPTPWHTERPLLADDPAPPFPPPPPYQEARAV